MVCIRRNYLFDIPSAPTMSDVRKELKGVLGGLRSHPIKFNGESERYVCFPTLGMEPSVLGDLHELLPEDSDEEEDDGLQGDGKEEERKRDSEKDKEKENENEGEGEGKDEAEQEEEEADSDSDSSTISFGDTAGSKRRTDHLKSKGSKKKVKVKKEGQEEKGVSTSSWSNVKIGPDDEGGENKPIEIE